MTAKPWTFCQCCGERPADTHEICSRGSGGPTEAWNQLELCRIHHSEYHTIGWFAFGKKYPRMYGKIVSARRRMGRTTESRVEGEVE